MDTISKFFLLNLGSQHKNKFTIYKISHQNKTNTYKSGSYGNYGGLEIILGTQALVKNGEGNFL